MGVDASYSPLRDSHVILSPVTDNRSPAASQESPPVDDKVMEKPDGLHTVLAIVIAVVTVLSAFISWRVAVLEDHRVAEDLDGLLASVNQQEARVLGHATAYDDLAAFTRYWQYSRLAESIMGDLQKAGDDDLARLEADLREYTRLALDHKGLFPTRYLTTDENYDLNRQLGELWADASDEKDLDPTPHFAESDNGTIRIRRLLAAAAILSVGLVCFALVESLGTHSRYAVVLMIAGSVIAITGLIVAGVALTGSL